MGKIKLRLHWLKIGDEIKTGDFCWDKRSQEPVKHTAVHYWRGRPSKTNPPTFITKDHHPHFRIVKKNNMKTGLTLTNG